MRAAGDWLARLEAETAAAMGLPNAAYSDPAVLALERRRILRRHWIAVGHAADAPAPGDVVPVEAAGAPLLLVRGRDGALRVFHNVCSHRGLKLVEAPCGGRPTILCPYHGWAYDLTGRLRATPDFGGYGRREAEGFARERHGLRQVRSAEALGGLVFVDLSDAAPPFEDWAAPLLQRWAAYRFERLRHVHREDCVVEANWKLAAENFVDTLHLDWVHPQVVGYSKPEDHFDVVADPVFGSGSLRALSADPLARALPGFPGLPPELAERGEFLFLYPNLLLFLMPSHLFSIVLEAEAPDRTRERLDLAVVTEDEAEPAEEAVRWWAEGWRRLNEQDLGMLRRLQQGRASPGFDGGCFSGVMDRVAHALQRRIAADLSEIERTPGMTRPPRFFPASGREVAPYTTFDNAYPDGGAEIARLVGPEISGTLGGGVVTYRRVRTVWRLPFDEIVCILSGSMTVEAGGERWTAGPGDVLFFPKGEPIAYDVPEEVTVFYAKYPVTAST